MSSHFIFINSKDKQFGTNTDFTVNLADYDTQPGSTLAISLEGAVIPNMKYPILNQTLVIYENSVATPISVPLVDGYYDYSDFITMFETQLNTYGANTYVVSFDNNTYKLTIDSTLPDTVQFRFEQSSNYLNKILGFTTGPTSDVTILTGDYAIDLSGTKYVDISLEGVGNNNMITSYISNSIVGRVHMTVPFGGIQFYNSQESSDYSILDGRSLYRLRVRVIDENGDIWLIPETFDIVLTLRLTYLLS